MNFRSKPPLGQQINWAHPLAKGLVAYWRLQGKGNINGTRVYDSSLGKHHGAISSDTGFDIGLMGIGLQMLDGGDGINVGYATSLGDISTGDHTILCWATCTTGGNDIFATGAGTAGDILLQAEAGKHPKAHFYTNGGSGNVIGVGTMSSNAISMIGQYFEGTTLGTIFDGKREANTVNVGGTPVVAPSPFAIGQRGPGNFALSWIGYIGLVVVYNRALNNAELQALYTNPYAIFEAPLPIELVTHVAAGGLSIPVAMHHYQHNLGK